MFWFTSFFRTFSARKSWARTRCIMVTGKNTRPYKNLRKYHEWLRAWANARVDYPRTGYVCVHSKTPYYAFTYVSHSSFFYWLSLRDGIAPAFSLGNGTASNRQPWLCKKKHFYFHLASILVSSVMSVGPRGRQRNLFLLSNDSNRNHYYIGEDLCLRVSNYLKRRRLPKCVSPQRLYS